MQSNHPIKIVTFRDMLDIKSYRVKRFELERGERGERGLISDHLSPDLIKPMLGPGLIVTLSLIAHLSCVHHH